MLHLTLILNPIENLETTVIAFCDLYARGDDSVHRQSKCHMLFTGMVVPAVFLAICLTGLSGCSGTHGRLEISLDVKDMFERYEVLPDHRYFYTESSVWPRAVIGLHKDYTLQSDFWHPVKVTSEQLNRWLNFQGHSIQHFIENNGSNILDQDGRKIGVWYALKSKRDWGVVKIIDDKTVNIILVSPPREVLRPLFGQFYEE